MSLYDSEEKAARGLVEALKKYLTVPTGQGLPGKGREVEGGERQEACHCHIKDLLQDQLSLMESMAERKDTITGIPTGFRDLDQMTSGLQRGNLIVLAAWPSLGKTSLALQLATNVALDAQIPTLFVSTEMSKENLTTRLLFRDARIDKLALRRGGPRDTDRENLAHSAGVLSEADLYIDDTCFRNNADLDSRIQRIQTELESEKKRLGLVVLDSLDSRKLKDFEDGILLKQIAKKHELCVLALCRLGNEGVLSENRTPLLADLWSAGSIESYADLVLFLHRDGVYVQNPPNRSPAEVIVAKNRHGPTGALNLHFLPAYGKFEELGDSLVKTRPRPPKQKNVYFACSDGDPLVSKLKIILKKELPEGFLLEELLNHWSLQEYERDEIISNAEAGYQAFFFGGTWCLKKGDRFESVDLWQLGTLFGASQETAARVLFDAADDDDESFSWKGLAGLLATDPENLVSWGDGSVSNGHWLIKAPEARGLLGIEFSSPSVGIKTSDTDYTWILETSGFQEGSINKLQDSSLARVGPAGALVNRAYLENLLAAFGAGSYETGDVKVYCKGVRDRVVLVVKGEPRAVLMPMEG